MPDHNDEQLRNALRDLHDAALPHITPPGLPHLHRKIRRRVAVQLATVTAAAVGVMLALVLTIPLSRSGPGPADDPTATPSATVSSGASATPTPTPSSASVAAGQSVACDSDPHVGWSYTPPRVSFWLYSTSGAPLCAGAELLFGWASFYYLEDGSQSLYTGATWPARTGLTSVEVGRHPTCAGDLYFFTGPFAKTLLAPGEHNPFPAASSANNWQGTVQSVIVESSPCVMASPTTSGPP